ncbi:MAG TPA: MFS transporter [Marmoricola sp.]|nr:MFS transporter [Marmoricola sp.]
MSSPAAPAPPVTLSERRLAAARRAVAVVFAVNGACFATWASRIPDVKHVLALSPGRLGLVLLAIAVGSLLGLPASGSIAARWGSRSTVQIGVGCLVGGQAVAAVGVSVVGSAPVLACGLLLGGLGFGVWDVGMNLEGAAVERHLRRSIMPRFHAAFSAGTVAGALVGAGLSAAGVPVGLHLVVVSTLLGLVGLRAGRHFLPRAAEEEVHAATEGIGAPSAGPLAAWREPRTLLIGLVVLVAAFTEGTANDWMSLAFVDGHDLPAWAGVLGLAAFLTAMTLGRLLGTHALDRHGRVPTLRLLFLAAGAGSLLVVLGDAPLAYLGALLWGLGASLGFPVGMSAAADDPRRAAARMSVVSTIGYTAFLGGPPLLGLLGDHVGVLHALLVVAAGGVVALLLVPATAPLVLRRPDSPDGRCPVVLGD